MVLQALDAPSGIQLPDGWEMEVQSIRYVASVYDNNYYPMNSLDLASQPVTAQLGSQNANATTDPLLNYQGRIGAYNVSGGSFRLNIQEAFDRRMYHVPIKFINKSGNGSFMTFDYYNNKIIAEATIPARYIKNSATDKKVYLQLYWGEQIGTLVTNNTSIQVDAFICAETPIELVQLDMNRGIGQDGKGILLTTFNIKTDKLVKNLELRLLPAIPDRYADQKTNSYAGAWAADEYEHDMFYMPFTAPDGKAWLTNDLGAGYATLKNYYFNPLHRAGSTDENGNNLMTPTTLQIKRDVRGYGSLYQWQRKSDGHELINWKSSIQGLPKYSGSGSLSSSWINAGTNRFITGGEQGLGWVIRDVNINTASHYMWLANGENNPCPIGFHVPSSADIEKLNAVMPPGTLLSKFLYYSLDFRFPTAGGRGDVWDNFYGTGGGYSSSYWLSDTWDDMWSRLLRVSFGDSPGPVGTLHGLRSSATPLRCIQD
ncbi:hypothetical protein PG623_06160 [Riemerella anatipestifer]|nr:hypothetical protein [Riemerella anatipestifer]